MRFLLRVWAILLVTCQVLSPISAAPSAKLQAALAGRAEALILGEHSRDIVSAISQVIYAAHPTGVTMGDKVGIEYISGERMPSVTSEIPAGRLGDQLDAVAKSVGYVLQANGDWLNFIPKSKADDPEYIMNLSIPGTVVVSRYFGTPLKNWFDAHHASSGRELSGIRPSVPIQYGPDPVILENPTLREQVNAHESLYGSDRWVVNITTFLAKDGSRAGDSLVFWSRDTKALLKAAGKYPK